MSLINKSQPLSSIGGFSAFKKSYSLPGAGGFWDEVNYKTTRNGWYIGYHSGIYNDLGINYIWVCWGFCRLEWLNSRQQAKFEDHFYVTLCSPGSFVVVYGDGSKWTGWDYEELPAEIKIV